MAASSLIHDFAIDIIFSLEEKRENNENVLHVLKSYLEEENEKIFGEKGTGELHFKKLGKIIFPYYSLGNVKSFHHFEYRELVLFCIYHKLSHRYQKFLDVGGNLGLHSTIYSNLSNSPICFYEPDPILFYEANRRFALNGSTPGIKAMNIAISNFDGTSNFVRVLDNTTASHLQGAREFAYGPLEEFNVEVRSLDSQIVIGEKTLGKLDIEGSEARALSNVSFQKWDYFDALVEVTNLSNAKLIFQLAKDMKLKILSQKICWEEATEVFDLPHNYREGSILVTRHITTQELLH